ncbi:hypothetical protein [Paenibacillus tyrfis]|uniref:Uncharacterized protein n=1 Tax=Paenibacillus tyrfis TaxID=1501230 RepID=A0A081NU63_9BACL|nr:hypothetical protein [Paenibacillus tyrfis]KEQ21986.1 hypothetical protein ET33_28365 [Paenibacillus tyrfis]
MIIQQSLDLTQKITGWNQSMVESKNATAYQDRYEKLKELANRLETVFNTYHLLTASDIESFSTVAPYIQEIKSYVENLREQFRTQTNWGIEPQVLTELQRKVQHLVDSINRQASVAWSDYIERNRPPIQMSLLSTLLGIPGFRENVMQIRTLIDNLENLKRYLPTSKSDIDSVKDINKMIMHAWTKIGAEDIPDDVQHFLQQAASSGGIALEAYTQSIRDWLVQHRLTSHFCIRTLSS